MSSFPLPSPSDDAVPVMDPQAGLPSRPLIRSDLIPILYSPGAHDGWYSPVYHLPAGILTPSAPGIYGGQPVVTTREFMDCIPVGSAGFNLGPLPKRKGNNKPPIMATMAEPAMADPTTIAPVVENPELKEKINEAISNQQNIYIRGLATGMTDEQLAALCANFGRVVSAKAIIEQTPTRMRSGEMVLVNGACKGYGFAMYECHEDAVNAMNGLNYMGFQVSLAKESFSSRLKNLQDGTSTNIYLSNLPVNLTEPELLALFVDVPGEVISSRILRDQRTGHSRGVGFARLNSRQAAQEAINRLNGLVLVGSTYPLQVRFADNNAQKKLKTQAARRRQLHTVIQPPPTLAIPAAIGFAPVSPSNLSQGPPRSASPSYFDRSSQATRSTSDESSPRPRAHSFGDVTAAMVRLNMNDQA